MDRPSKPDRAPSSRPPARPVPLPRLPEALARASAPDKRGGVHKFDKAFPVFVRGERGLLSGVGRNITREGMFVETREPCPIGSEVRVTFAEPALGTEITAVGEVRYQCFLNFAGAAEGEHGGLRGIGVRFTRFEESGRPPRSPLQ